MAKLKAHEHIVLDILVSGIIPAHTLKTIKENPVISDYDVTGNGYFLTIRNSSLPIKRIVCSKPMLVGKCGDIEAGFIVFIENRELTIECHGWGNREIPKNYRESDIRIIKT